MSQIYQVSLKETVCQEVTLSDHVTHKLNITPILDQEEMLTLLEDLLIAEGYEREGEGRALSQRQESGEVFTFDLERQEVRVSLEERESLETQVSVQQSADLDHTTKKQLEQRAREALSQRAQEAQAELSMKAKDRQIELTRRLSEGVEGQRAQLNTLLQKLYAESVKRKAAQLGDVMEVRESTDNGQYELVIKIER